MSSARPRDLDTEILCQDVPAEAHKGTADDEASPTTLVGSRSEGVPSPLREFREKPEVEQLAIPSQREKWRAPHSPTWIPSVLRAGPLVGLAALAFAVLQVFASYAVLRASDGDAVTDWKYQPTVYLAILTAISSNVLAFAMVQGSIVTFWLKALDGTNLAQMHRNWAFGLYVRISAVKIVINS